MAPDGVISFERRRSERSLRSVRVFVYGHAPGEKPFHEESTTLEISSRGGLLVLGEEVFVGQKLLLANIRSHHEQECTVVRFASKNHQRIVAVEFAPPSPDFWGLDSRPPENLIDSPRWDSALFGPHSD